MQISTHTHTHTIHSTRRQRKAVMKTRTAKPMSSQTSLAKSEIGTNCNSRRRRQHRSRFRSLSLGSGAPQVKHLLAQAFTVSWPELPRIYFTYIVFVAVILQILQSCTYLANKLDFEILSNFEKKILKSKILEFRSLHIVGQQKYSKQLAFVGKTAAGIQYFKIKLEL